MEVLRCRGSDVEMLSEMMLSSSSRCRGLCRCRGAGGGANLQRCRGADLEVLRSRGSDVEMLSEMMLSRCRRLCRCRVPEGGANLQRCRGAEVQRCRGAGADDGAGAEVQVIVQLIVQQVQMRCEVQKRCIDAA